MIRIDRIIGPLIASMAAGPLTVLPLLVQATMALYPQFRAILGGTGFVLLLSVLIGFAVSLIPTFAGTWLMLGVGQRWPPARHPLAWAMAGFAGGFLIAVAFDAGSVSMTSFWMGAVGAACALICRAFSRPSYG